MLGSGQPVLPATRKCSVTSDISPATTQASWRSAAHKAALCNRAASPLPSDGRQWHGLVLALAFSLLSFFSPQTFAESKTFGNYTVHYIAVNSTFLTPEIAQQYKIVRSARRAFLNIAVLRNNADGSTTPVAAKVEGGKRNLMQQAGAIDFVEVREGESIYYIGQFDFSNAEILRFNVQVTPAGETVAQAVEWTTQLYSD